MTDRNPQDHAPAADDQSRSEPAPDRSDRQPDRCSAVSSGSGQDEPGRVVEGSHPAAGGVTGSDRGASLPEPPPPPGLTIADSGGSSGAIPGPVAGEGKPRRRRWLRLMVMSVLVGALLLVTVLLTLAWLANDYARSGKLRNLLLARLSEMVGRPVNLGEVAVEFPTVIANDLEVAGPASDSPPLLSVGRLTVTPNLFDLLGGTFSLSGLMLSSATVHLVERPGGGFELPSGLAGDETATPTAPASAAGPVMLPLTNLQIRDFTLLLSTIAYGRHEVAVRRLDLVPNGPLSAAGAVLGVTGEVLASGLARLALEGQVNWPRSVQMSATVDQVRRAGLLPLLPPGTNIPADLERASLKAELTYDLGGGLVDLRRAQLTIDQGPEIVVTGLCQTRVPITASLSAELKPVAAVRLLALAKPYLPPAASGVVLTDGQVHGALAISRDAAGTNAMTGRIRLAKLAVNEPRLPVPLTGIGGDIVFDGSRVQVPAVVLAIPGLQGQIRQVEARWEPVVRVSGEVAADVELARIFPTVKGFLPDVLHGLAPEGQVKFAGRFEVDPAGPVLDGEAELSGVGVTPMPVSIRAEGIAGKVRLVRIGRNGRIELSGFGGRFAGAALSLAGTVTPAPTGIQLALQAGATGNLAELHRALPIENEIFQRQTTIDGRIQASARITGALPKPKLEADASIDAGRFAWAAKGIAVDAIRSTVRADLESVEIRTLVASAVGGQLQLSGRVRNFEHPTLQASGTLNGVQLAAVTALLRRNLASFPPELEVGGLSDVQVTVSGPALDPKVNGQVRWRQGRFVHPAVLRPLEAIDGSFGFDTRQLTVTNLRTHWGTSVATVRGTIRDLERFETALDYTVEPLDVGDAAGFFLAGTGYRVIGVGEGHGRVTGPLATIRVDADATVPNLEAQVPVASSSASRFRFPLTGVALNAFYHQGVLQIPSLKANLFEGPITGSGRIELEREPIAFSFDVKGDKVKLESLMAANTKYPNAAKGRANLGLACSGNVAGVDTFNGKGHFTLPDGEYQSPPVLGDILSVLQLQRLANGRLTNSGGPFLVENGMVKVTDLELRAPEGRLTYTGTVGLDTSLNGNAQLWLTEAVAKSTPVLAKAAGPDGVTIPVRLRGSIGSPKVDVDLGKLVQRAAQQQVQNAIERAIIGRLGGSAVASEAATASGTGPVDPRKQLQQALGQAVLGRIGGASTPPAAGTPPSTASGGVIASAPATPATPQQQLQRAVETQVGNQLNRLLGGKRPTPSPAPPPDASPTPAPPPPSAPAAPAPPTPGVPAPASGTPAAAPPALPSVTPSPASAAPPPPAPASSPQRPPPVDQQIKKIGKDLKKIFKF